MRASIYRSSALTWINDVAPRVFIPHDVALLVLQYLRIVNDPPTLLDKVKQSATDAASIALLYGVVPVLSIVDLFMVIFVNIVRAFIS